MRKNHDKKNAIVVLHAAELFAKLSAREQQNIIKQMKILLSER